MVELPTEQTVLVTFDVALKCFTEGEFEYQETFTKDVCQKLPRISSALSDKVANDRTSFL